MSMMLLQQRRVCRHASPSSTERHDEFFKLAAKSGGSSSPSLNSSNDSNPREDKIEPPILSSDLLAKIEAFGQCLINNTTSMAAVPSLSIHDFLLSSVITASSSSPNASERGGNAATTTTGTIPFPAIIIIDVRTPSEYEQGHIPNAINIPLFTNEERVEVGTLYKQHSRTVAIRRGLELVSPRIMTHLASQLLLVSQQQQPQPQQPNIPYLYIYCHRGGMRSASVAWLAQNLLHIPNVITLIGGYKSYRRHVLDLFNDDDDDDDSRNNQTTSSTTTTYSYTWPQIHLLGGRTGCGKTDILLALRDNNNNHERSVAVVDLEGLANHRGSSYGSVGLKNNNQQPTVEQFENNLHDTILPMLLMMKNNSTVKQQIWLENENIMIGQCRIPTGLWNRMKVAPMVTIHRTFEERVSYLVSIYVNNTDDGGVVDGDDVIDNDNDHSNNNGDATTNTTTTSVGTLLSDATRRISKRLGPQRTTLALEAIEAGKWDVACRHILDYYDRTYDNDISTRKSVVVDVSGFSATEAANVLIDQGHVIPFSWGDRNEITAT